MNKDSRTYKSLKNSVVALSFYAITFFLSFISRRVFLDQLGAEVLGLNTTAGSLLSFLNLAELGIGTAIAVTLYKPLQEKNIAKINEIVSVQGWFYQRVAMCIIAGSAVMMLFFPKIFSKSDLPLWYAYASYSILLFSSLLGYFVNYRQIVLSASQQQYKIQFSYSSISILKVIAQLFAVTYLPWKYQAWLCLEVLFAILASITLNVQIHKTFPKLKTQTRLGRTLRHKYPDVLTKIKQLFVHKIGAFALNQTSPIIIYAYASLTLVTNYGNYIVITHGISSILNAMFNSMNAGVGNLVAEGDKQRTLSVFRELFSSRFLIIGTICICLYFLSSPFIRLWLGDEFILKQNVVLLIVLLFFIRTTREVVDSFINAYGLFQDIWAPAVEAVLNIGCSILFGYWWGLPGILGGVLLSQVLIILIWKPYLLFKKGFQKNIWGYICMYSQHLLLLGITVSAISLMIRLIPINPDQNFMTFALYGLAMELTALIILGSMLFAIEPGMHSFYERIKMILTHRWK